MGQEDRVLGSRTSWDITMWMRGYEGDWTRKAAFCQEGRFFISPLIIGDILLDLTHYLSRQIGLPVSPQKTAGYLGPSWRDREPMNLLLKIQFAIFPRR
jgi:hypothetical protein